MRAVSQVLFYCRQNLYIHLLSLQNSRVGLENSFRAKIAQVHFLIFEIKPEPVSVLLYLKPQCSEVMTQLERESNVLNAK